MTLIARNEKKLKKVLSSLDTKIGQSHNYLCVDFNKTSNLIQSLKELSNIYHILINNTGGPAGGPITDANSTDFKASI